MLVPDSGKGHQQKLYLFDYLEGRPQIQVSWGFPNYFICGRDSISNSVIILLLTNFEKDRMLEIYVREIE